MFDPQDHYFHKAKKEGFIARSAFKLEEIDNKFNILDKNTENVLDIGCAPGSRIQYTSKKLESLNSKFKIIGLDLKPMNIEVPGAKTYVQDASDIEKVKEILHKENLTQLDIIISDLAPNTIGVKDIDAMRSIGILEKIIPIYQNFLKPKGKFVIKTFMGPGFDEFFATLKKMFGAKNIKIFKPKASRSESKETYIIKI